MTYKEIVSAMRSVLEHHFENVHITSGDITEGFQRPSFFMEFIAPKSTLVAKDRRKRSFTLRLSYFPKSRTENFIELLEIQEALERRFSEGTKIKVADVLLNTDQGCQCRVTNKVLHCDVRFICFERIEPQIPDADLMEDITIKTNMKK